MARDDVNATDDSQIDDDDTSELTETVVDVDDDEDIDFDGDDEVDVDGDVPGVIQDDIGDGDELIPNLDDKDEN